VRLVACVVVGVPCSAGSAADRAGVNEQRWRLGVGQGLPSTVNHQPNRTG
jgi:hypothetical protein